jgi:hypothetical protein
MARKPTRAPQGALRPGLREARRLLTLPTRTPNEGDRPPPQPLRGRKPVHIPGQLELTDIREEEL